MNGCLQSRMLEALNALLAPAVMERLTLMINHIVAAEPVTQGTDRRVGDLVFTGDLAKGGAGDEAVEDELEQVGALEPIGGGEGL